MALLTRAEIAALTDGERLMMIKEMDADLVYVLADAHVAIVEQSMISNRGYKNLKVFLGLADTKPDLRAALRVDFGLDPAAAAPDGPRNRSQVACILSAWESARDMATRDSQLRAEAKANGVRRLPTFTERAAMKRVVENTYGPLPS